MCPSMPRPGHRRLLRGAEAVRRRLLGSRRANERGGVRSIRSSPSRSPCRARGRYQRRCKSKWVYLGLSIAQRMGAARSHAPRPPSCEVDVEPSSYGGSAVRAAARANSSSVWTVPRTQEGQDRERREVQQAQLPGGSRRSPRWRPTSRSAKCTCVTKCSNNPVGVVLQQFMSS
jgi:hypothetical protein